MLILHFIYAESVFNLYGYSSRPEGTAPNDWSGASWRVPTPASVECNYNGGAAKTLCDPSNSNCLFDLTRDPCELENLADRYPAMLNYLQEKIRMYNTTAALNVYKTIDPKANPDLWGGIWSPWLEPSGNVLDKEPMMFEPFSPSTATWLQPRLSYPNSHVTLSLLCCVILYDSKVRTISVASLQLPLSQVVDHVIRFLLCAFSLHSTSVCVWYESIRKKSDHVID